MQFEDTQLLDHPTVRKAYTVMRGFFSKGDDFAKQAVLAGEIITRHAKNPDPDAIAASVLLGGMVIPYSADPFEQSVSPGAADYVRRARATGKFAFASEADRQFMLALHVVGLGNIRDKMGNNEFWQAKEISKLITNNERGIIAAAQGSGEEALVHLAWDSLLETRLMLEKILQTTEEKFRFENSGLPNHPTVKKAYALIRTNEKKRDPFMTNYTEMGAGIAKVLFETGTTDPDILGAAILNQHYAGRSAKGGKKTVDMKGDWAKALRDNKDEGLAALTQKFSARLVEIYLDTSPFGRDPSEKSNRPVTDERALISAATYVYILESQMALYLEEKKRNNGDFKSYTAPRMLERIENYVGILRSQAERLPEGSLKARMEKSMTAAEKLMNAPSNVKIRKPGSPAIDQGWGG